MPPPSHLRCPSCGTANHPHMTWCIECGDPLDGSVTPAPVPVGSARPAGVAPPPAARTRRWEMWLGALLVLGVLGWGLGDWVIQEQVATAYQRGVVAQAAYRWAEAAAAFAEAGSYRDAPQRAAAAAATFTNLTTGYATGIAAQAARDWDAAETALAGVAALQPDYKDVAARLVTVRRALTVGQAAGIIYSTTGPDGGLYALGPNGPPAARLPDSTPDSRVRFYAPGGRYVIYSAGPPGDPANDVGGTILLLADLADPRGPQARPLPPTFRSIGRGMAGGDGFWWFNAGPADLGAGAYYYTYATHQATVLPARPGWTVAATDARHAWLLLAQPETAVAGPPQTTLHLADAAGEPFELAATLPGRVEDAQISEDGQFVLLTQVTRDTAVLTRTLVLLRMTLPIDPGPPSRPRRVNVLDTLTVPIAQPISGGRLAARFLPGSLPTRALADRTDPLGRRQTLYNLDSGVEVTYWNNLPAPAVMETFSLSRAGGLVLTQHPTRTGALLTVQPTARLTERYDLAVPVSPETWVIGQIARRADYLIYTTTLPPLGGARQGYKLYSAPLEADGRPGPARLLYSAFYDRRGVPAPAPTLAPGGRALLYLTPQGDLTATTLDGATQTLLATAVRRQWTPP